MSNLKMQDRIVFTVRVPVPLNEKVIELCHQKGLQKNSLVTMAIEEYVKKNLKDK